MKIRATLIPLLMLGFILGIKDGRVALWKDGESEPTVFPYRAALLPKTDQRRLKEGIRLENESELRQLLEDYLS